MSTATEILSALTSACGLLSNSVLNASCQAAAGELVGLLEGPLGVKYLIGKYSPVAVCSILGLCENECCQTPNQPEQVLEFGRIEGYSVT